MPKSAKPNFIKSKPAKEFMTFRVLPEGGTQRIVGQVAKTLRLLLSHKRGVDPNSAQREAGIGRLAQRISDLKKRGVECAASRVRIGNANLARYVLGSRIEIISSGGYDWESQEK